MAASLEKTVIVTETGNGPYAQVVTTGHHVMGADEPELLGGRDTGPSPYEYVLAGLGACTAMTLRMYATQHAWPLEKVSVELSHDKVMKDGQASKVDRFRRTVRLVGALTDQQRARLLEIAQKCPVSRTLQAGSLVETQLEPEVAVGGLPTR